TGFWSCGVRAGLPLRSSREIHYIFCEDLLDRVGPAEFELPLAPFEGIRTAAVRNRRHVELYPTPHHQPLRVTPPPFQKSVVRQPPPVARALAKPLASWERVRACVS